MAAPVGIVASHRTETATFDPSTITGLALWLKADAISTLFQDSTALVPVLLDGDPVGAWHDSSSAARNTTQATSGNRPTYKTSIVNGKPVIRFDGTDDHLDITSGLDLFQNRSGMSVFVVAATDTVVAGNRFMFFASRGTDPNGHSTARAVVESNRTTGGNLGAGGRRLDGDSFQSVQVNTLSASTFFYAGVLFDYANNDLFIRKNGSQVGSSTTFQSAGSTSNTGSVTMAVGAQGSFAPVEFWDGDIAEILIYTSVLTGTDLSNVESYLASKYAI